MTTARWNRIAVTLASAMALGGTVSADRALAEMVPLSVVYGPQALTREGDLDNHEQLFISVPADFQQRLFLRVFDPDMAGLHDTAYGSVSDTTTLFRLVGGDGAFTGRTLAPPVADGASAAAGAGLPLPPTTGVVIAEQRFGADAATDDRWATLAPFLASQGEIQGDRAYFRLDVVGEAGNDANVFAFDVSLVPDSSQPLAELRLFAFSPTLRWPGTAEALVLRLAAPAGEQVTLQNFDAAAASLALVSTFEELALPSSGQDVWASTDVVMPDGEVAITFSGGTESPNDATFALFDKTGQPLPFELPATLEAALPRPTAEALATPLADCRAVAFDGSRSTGDGPLRMEWLFGDGQGSTAPVVVHRYAAPGAYVAELRVQEAVDRLGAGNVARLPVLIRDRPVAVAGDAVVAAPGDEILFDGAASVPSDLPIESFLWSFGDGTTASGALARKVYTDPGVYRSVLRVADSADHPCNFGSAQRLVTINFPPVAEAGDARSAAVGQPVRFDGGASYDVDGQIAEWRWTFGDGASADQPAVDHAFQAPGVYEARLTVTDDAAVGNSTTSDTVRITVNAPPVAVSTRPERPIAVGEVVRFDATQSTDPDGEIIDYQWTFGDGASAQGAVVDYAFGEAGSYQVSLTTRDNSATASDTAETVFQVVVSAAPVADAGPDQVVTASEVIFDGSGSRDIDGEITHYAWTFGDGAVGEGRVVRHAYVEPGVYEVSLTVRDDSGAPLNVHRDLATVRINQTPIADAGPDMIAAPGQELRFDAAGSIDPDGTIESYLWHFADGTEAVGRQVRKSFDQPGSYRVALTVQDDTGHAAAIDIDEARVTVNAAPIAAAGPDQRIAPGTTLQLSGAASFDPDGELEVFRWDFDDLTTPIFGRDPERRYTQPGIYTAQLTVADDSGTLNATASDELLIHVNHPPLAEAGADIRTDRLLVTFDGSGSSDADGDSLIFSWDPGDGSPPLAGRTVSHTYPRSGIFPVTLTVDDGSGLDNAVAVDATRVVIDSRPIAVAGGNRDVCSGETILFDGSASADPDGGLLNYEWDFGDGTRADLVNPAKTYERPGVFSVTLTVRDETGAASGVHSDRVVAIVREAPIAVAGPPLKACTNQTIRFDGSRSTDADGAVDQFVWSFGDGSTGGGEKPTHVYDRPGEYRVILTITGDSQGTCNPLDTDTTTVTVIEAPLVSIEGPERVAVGIPATFRAVSSAVAGAGAAEIDWQLPDGETAAGPTVDYSFSEPGVYEVALTARFAGGQEECGAIHTRLKVVANAPPVAAAAGPDSVALGEALLFDASGSSDPDGAVTGFAWDFGDGTTATGMQARHQYTAPGIHELVLMVTDDAAVENSTTTLTRQIMVNPPTVAGLQAPWPLCPGVDHTWTAPVPDGGSAIWHFGDLAAVTGSVVEHAFTSPGLYPVALTLDDGRGLANSVHNEAVFVRVNRPPEAEAGPDQLACAGDVVSFDAAGSIDHDGKLSGFTWRFTDDVVLNGSQVERQFALPGSYDARLTVTDETGSSCGMAEDTARVRINAPPTVDLGPDLEGPIGAAHDVFLFDASAAHDPDGDGVAITWDLGDGTRRTGAVIRHRYSAPGDYVVTVEARDSTGLVCGIATDTARVTARARF